MTIAFDIDGVVLNSIHVIIERINHLTGRAIRASDLFQWEIESLGLEMELVMDAVRWMYSRPAIEPYEGAVDVLSRVHRETGEPLLFITGRHDPETGLNQLRALEWKGPAPEMIVVGGDRDKRRDITNHNVRFIVEDDVRHVPDYLAAGVGVGLMVRPWNQRYDAPVTERFFDWSQLEHWYFNKERARPQ
jgi:hypothetical protein